MITRAEKLTRLLKSYREYYKASYGKYPEEERQERADLSPEEVLKR